MYDFILQFLIMSSLAVIIYLVARTIPRINENIVFRGTKKSFFDNLISKLPLEKVDSSIKNLLEKLLRRFKIVVMKIDNILTQKLSGFKSSSSGERTPRLNIFEDSGHSTTNPLSVPAAEKKEDNDN